MFRGVTFALVMWTLVFSALGCAAVRSMLEPTDSCGITIGTGGLSVGCEEFENGSE